MPAPQHPATRPARDPPPAPDTALLTTAEDRLAEAFDHVGCLSPNAVAHIVADTLPEPQASWLLTELEQLGWLDDEHHLPADALDAPDCPPELAGAWRPFAQLATFGLPGQGLSARDRHRDDLYQRMCAEIMREAVDLGSLEKVAARVLRHPEANRDALLGSMLRGFVSQRRTALQTLRTPAERHQLDGERSKLASGFTGRDGPSERDVRLAWGRFRAEFDRHMTQFKEQDAGRDLQQLRDVRRRHRKVIPAEDLQACEEQYDAFLKRVGTYRRQIRELASQGRDAARRGDEETAAWVERRLRAIHSLIPTLLGPQDLEALADSIQQGESEHEADEHQQAVFARQRAVARQIRQIAHVIQNFHNAAAELRGQRAAYETEHARYLGAIQELQKLDTEWLSGLVLELESLVDAIDNNAPLQDQLDRFIANVRGAINRLCNEIRAFRKRNGRG